MGWLVILFLVLLVAGEGVWTTKEGGLINKDEGWMNKNEGWVNKDGGWMKKNEGWSTTRSEGRSSRRIRETTRLYDCR